MVAASKGKLEIVLELLDSGANIEAKNRVCVPLSLSASFASHPSTFSFHRSARWWV